MNLNNESVETLQIIYNKIYKNASELIEDGIILLEKDKYSRSYLCFQIALEELAKLPMINSIAFKVFNKEKVDWKTLNKRLRDHHKKIGNPY
ncbi:AbiV family abortive infection protein [Lysinibacillus sp. LK3]|uniref:AbiV family abortive infection protein n=1 Tax=Lysinibacillus sp. LK3 TaxID=1628207 RepID=UPI00069D7FDD